MGAVPAADGLGFTPLTAPKAICRGVTRPATTSDSPAHRGDTQPGDVRFPSSRHRSSLQPVSNPAYRRAGTVLCVRRSPSTDDPKERLHAPRLQPHTARVIPTRSTETTGAACVLESSGPLPTTWQTPP